MKNKLIFFTALCLLLFCACAGKEPVLPHETEAAQTGVPSGTEPNASSVPEPIKIGLPEGFAPREHDHADSAVFGEAKVTLNITDPMALVKKEGGEAVCLAFGNILNEPFAGVTQKGVYICTGPELFGREGELEPADSLFFCEVGTGEITRLGRAVNFGTLCGDCIVGVRYARDAEDVNAETVTIIRHDLKDGSQTELLELRIGDVYSGGDTFYAKSFDGKYVYYTFLRGLDTTDFGIYRLDPMTGETQKVTESGLPFGLNEKGALLYGDYTHN